MGEMSEDMTKSVRQLQVVIGQHNAQKVSDTRRHLPEMGT